MAKNKDSGFVSHLIELRQRLINSLIFLAILFVICYFFSEHIYGFLVDPYAEAVKKDGTEVHFSTTCRLDTPVEVDYYRNGGILQTVLRNLAKE